jgi:NADH-quinone oxidoreductase subunit J
VEQLLFFVGAFGAIAGAMGVVVLRSPFYAVLSLFTHLFSLALLFLLLNAEFLAGAQVIVYGVAVMVMYVFVVAYIGGADDPGIARGGAVARLGPLFAAALLAELLIAIAGSGLDALDSKGAEGGPGFGSPGEVGRLLLEKFLIPFEAASFLLLVAAVGAVVLSRRRRGLLDDAEDLPERAGRMPIGGRDAGGQRGVDESDQPPPMGTAEGPGDPTVERGDARGEPSRAPAPEEPEETPEEGPPPSGPGEEEKVPEVPA